MKVLKDYCTKREEWINGEPNTWIKKGKYAGLIIEITKDAEGFKLKVRGSLHKFYHSGNNAGTFTGMEVLGALQGIYDLFEVDPVDIKIQNLEVGINLPVWFSVFRYLELNLIYHKKKEKEEGDLKGLGFYFKHDEYWIKVYEKDKYVLRFEIKLKSQKKLNGFGIDTASDLNEQTISRLVDSLQPEWQEVVMRGGIDLFNEKRNNTNLSKKEIAKMHTFSSTGYQQSYNEELAKAKEEGDKNRSEALRVKANRLHRLCMAIIKERGDKYHSKIEKLIEEGVDLFKTTWSENVTVSYYDKTTKA